MGNVTIEIDVETYIDMLEERRKEFWVPDCVIEYYYELLRSGGIPDPQYASPSYIIDNISINGDYCKLSEAYYLNEFVNLINDCYDEERNTFDIWKNMDEIEMNSRGGYAIVADDMNVLTLTEAENSLEDFLKDHSIYSFIYRETENKNELIVNLTAEEDYIENDCKPIKELFNNFKENSLLGIKNFEIMEQNGRNFKIKVNCVPLPEDMYIIYNL